MSLVLVFFNMQEKNLILHSFAGIYHYVGADGMLGDFPPEDLIGYERKKDMGVHNIFISILLALVNDCKNIVFVNQFHFNLIDFQYTRIEALREKYCIPFLY